MTTERKRAANRRNAARSTGPRSAAGKARSRKNALRLGLAACLNHAHGHSEEIERLALAILGTGTRPDLLYYARRAAEAELEVLRVRAARAAFISRAAADPATFAPIKLISKRTIEGLRKIATAPPEIFEGLRTHASETLRRAEELNAYRLSSPLPEVHDRPAVALGRKWRELARFNRYERRALSRRKKALRAFDLLARGDKIQVVKIGAAK